MGIRLSFRATRTAVAILAFAAAPVALGAQVIRGVVYDDSTGARLAATAVMLVDPATDAAVVNAKTDSLGQFSFKVNRGVYQLAAIREGYTALLSAPIPLADGELMTVRVPIATSGYPRHKIGVLEHKRAADGSAATVRDSRLAEFERRMVTGTSGIQYDRSKLDKSTASTVADFLTRVPGVSVRDAALGSNVQSRRSGMYSGGPGGVSTCQMGWFIDGNRMDRPGMTDAFTQAYGATRLDDVQALEVFRGLSEMPAEFAAPDLKCGAIAIWTKRG